MIGYIENFCNMRIWEKVFFFFFVIHLGVSTGKCFNILLQPCKFHFWFTRGKRIPRLQVTPQTEREDLHGTVDVVKIGKL